MCEIKFCSLCPIVLLTAGKENLGIKEKRDVLGIEAKIYNFFPLARSKFSNVPEVVIVNHDIGKMYGVDEVELENLGRILEYCVLCTRKGNPPSKLKYLNFKNNLT